MVQGNGGPDNQPSNPQVDLESEQVIVSETPAPSSQQTFVEQHGQQVTHLSSHATGQRITLAAAPLGGTVNVIATPFATSAASGISASGSVPTTASNAGTTYQHYLIPNVSLGGQLQNITIPAQVALSSIRGANVTQTQAVVSSPTSTYTISSPQNLARILAAAATQNYSVRSRGSITATMASQQQQQQQLKGQSTGSAATVASVQLQKSSVAGGSAVLTMPGSPVSIQQQSHQQQQRIGENVAVRIAPTGLTGQPQTLLLDNLGGVHIQPGDVTKVHSYSVSKAVTMSSAPGSGMVTVSSLPVGPVTVTSSQQKVMCHIPQRVLTQKQCGSNPVSTNLVLQGINIQASSGLAPNAAMMVSAGSSGIARTNQQVGGSSAPKPKRIKLEERPPASEEIAAMRRKICDHRLVQFKNNKENYVEFLTELFFLQNGGNMMDYLAWKRRLTPQLLAFLKAHALDSDDEEEHRNLLLQQAARALAIPQVPCVTTATTTTVTVSVEANAGIMTQASKSLSGTPSSQPTSKHPLNVPSLSSSISSSIPGSHANSLSSASGQTVVTSSSGSLLPTKSPANTTAQKCAKIASLFTSNRLPVTRQHSISAVYDSSIGSQEEIVERAKQEAYVIQRISELRREGLWSSKRLPKVQELPRAKAHWDYLLEEMTWLATDFAQERKWKKAAAKKCARMVIKYHQEREQKAEKAEKEEQQRLRRIATQISKEIKQFWTNIEKLVEYKQQTRLDEKRKRALDLHLNFIVDQTEKYSSWLTQGMTKINNDDTMSFTSQSFSVTGTKDSTADSSPDEEFEPEPMESDDEETIAKAEEEDEKGHDQDLEVSMLKKESEVPLDELLQKLPPEIRDQRASPSVSSPVTVKEEPSDDVVGSTTKVEEVTADEEYRVSGEEDEEDDEATIAAAEREETLDYSAELNDLQKEGELSLEELYEKYAAAYTSDNQMSESSESEGAATENEEVDVVGDSDDSVTTSEEEESEDEDLGKGSDEEMEEVGMEYLVSGKNNTMGDQIKIKSENQCLQNTSTTGEEDKKGPTKEITDIAATALSFQPKGNTLSTTQVCTKVPFLLKHTLREYQHIGLDWLVAMQDKKLNGILADEMGLGKTIQTIALLAHLACEKGNWGPHLIVVPTSVMLNWEMEFKKWCPGFKILTYYGSQKDRKKKREGWTKPNTFHVCITSYKLVIQDHMAFRRKRWKYFILDEAHHIKNFKSQRWQMLLNFQSGRRLLLTGTPLQNSLLELWSLMHFLMPNVFQSHREFKEWFVNPVTGMIEGNHEYNENLIKRLHKILRPFLLRRLKCDVEKQLPKKYEHVIMCRLSTRQRYLYEDFMSQAKTRETLSGGNFLSVINVLMQLRKVCNHPNLFEARPTVSPFRMEGIVYNTASCVMGVLEYNPFQHVNLGSLNLWLCDQSRNMTAFAAHRVRKFQTPSRLIEEIDSRGDPPPKCPPGKIRLHIRTSSSVSQQQHHSSGMITPPPASSPGAAPGVITALMAPARTPNLINSSGAPLSPSVVAGITTTHHSSFVSPQQRILVMGNQNTVTSPLTAQGTTPGSEYSVQLVSQSGNSGQTAGHLSMAQLASLGVRVSPMMSSTPITVQVQQGGQGGAKVSVPLGFGRLVQIASGQHIFLTSNPRTASVVTNSDGTAQPIVVSTAANNQTSQLVIPHANKVSLPHSMSLASSSTPTGNKPVLRVAPLNVTPSTSSQNALGNANNTGNSVPPTQTTQEKPAIKEIPAVSNKEKTILKSRSLFYLEHLEEKRKERRKNKLRIIGKINSLHCMAYPVYGQDLVETVCVTSSCRQHSQPWCGQGYLDCLNAFSGRTGLESGTDALASLLYNPENRMLQLKDIISRFVFVVPVVTAPIIQMRVCYPGSSRLVQEKSYKETLQRTLSPKCASLHRVVQGMSTQFPELRLIQYDCGKLQTLDKLLWQLKIGGHRVLIFTQMTRMLDILEQFLNFHGHTYIRLDGTTRVDQRQVLMERFNADPRLFCFILSTRSGGIGINLTGADTVIFYDSDWNPTMDAQAQDRCHRIGQTRDVHIYRLISERTVEENILKKANQKRLLGDVAIEGGNFTTAFFKKNAIHELFGLDTSGEPETKKSTVAGSKGQDDTQSDVNQVQLEQALGLAEEDLDVQAAKTAKAEAAAELAEFDESIPLDTENSRDNTEEKSQAEEELDKLMEQLTPVEKYAMLFLESTQEPFTMEQLKQAEEEIEAQKKDWELGRLKALKEEEERRAAQLEEDEEPALTYTREDATNQVEKKNHKANRRQSRASMGTANKEGRVARKRTRHNSRLAANSKNPEVNGISDEAESKHSACHNHLANSSDVPDPFSTSAEQKKNLVNSETNCSELDCGSGDETKYSPVNFKNRRKVGDNTVLPAVKAPIPFSNPNLVIRTRRARQIENFPNKHINCTKDILENSVEPSTSYVVSEGKNNQFHMVTTHSVDQINGV